MTIKVKMTQADLDKITEKLDIVKRELRNNQQLAAIRYDICHRDVPDLLVEIKRLREMVYGR